MSWTSCIFAGYQVTQTTSPIVQSINIEETPIYGIYQLIGENMDTILIAGACFIGAFIASWLYNR